MHKVRLKQPIPILPEGWTQAGQWVAIDGWTMCQAKRWLKDNGLRWANFIKGREMEREVRLINMDFRAENRDGIDVVYGEAALYNSWSEDLGGFREMIMPGAFDGVEGNDIRALFNHDPNKILGRTTAGTLRVSSTASGFSYEYDSGGQTYANDLLISLRRKDVTQSSFQFIVDKSDSEWRRADDGLMERRIKRFKQIFDVSPVTFPAYPDTTVAKRSMELIEEEKKHAQEAAEAIEKAEVEAAEREAKIRELELQG